MSKSLLNELYDNVLLVSSPMNAILRRAAAMGRDADRLEQETLISGAMPGEFSIVYVFRNGFELHPCVR